MPAISDHRPSATMPLVAAYHEHGSRIAVWIMPRRYRCPGGDTERAPLISPRWSACLISRNPLLRMPTVLKRWRSCEAIVVCVLRRFAHVCPGCEGLSATRGVTCSPAEQ